MCFLFFLRVLYSLKHRFRERSKPELHITVVGELILLVYYNVRLDGRNYDCFFRNKRTIRILININFIFHANFLFFIIFVVLVGVLYSVEGHVGNEVFSVDVLVTFSAVEQKVSVRGHEVLLEGVEVVRGSAVGAREPHGTARRRVAWGLQ